MAKFCSSCGSAVNPGEKFCQACGAPIPAEPAAKPVPPPTERSAQQSAARPVSQPAAQQTQRPAPKPVSQPAARPAAQPAPAPAAQPADPAEPSAKTKKKSGKRGLSFFLALLLVVEICVAGFKYPGFLKKKTEPGTQTLPPTAELTETAEGLATAAEIEKVVSQLKAELSPEEYRALSPGSADSITLRISDAEVAATEPARAAVSPESPVASAGGVTVDFKEWNLPGEDTLEVRAFGTRRDEASGTTLTPYDLSLESGLHEFPLEVEITLPRPQDGHANGVVWYNPETDEWEPTAYDVSEDGRNYIVYLSHFTEISAVSSDWITGGGPEGGIFCTGLTDEEKKTISPEKLFRQPLAVSDEKLSEMFNVPDQNKKVLTNLLKSAGVDLGDMANSAFFKLFAATDTVKSHINIANPDFWGSFGKKYLAPIGALATTLSVVHALEDGDTVKEVLKDQGTNIAGTLIGLTAFLPVSAPVAIACAAISVVLFWAPSIADALRFPAFGDIENTYRYFLDTRWNYKGDPLLPDGTGWADQIDHILEEAKKKGAVKDGKNVVEDYFKSYVRGFWNMGKSNRREWLQKYYKRYQTPSIYQTRWKDPSDERREQMIAKVDQMLHEHTASILRAAYRKQRNEMMTEYKQTIEKTLLKYMNSYIVIDATDVNAGTTFDKTVFAKNDIVFEKLADTPAYWPADMSVNDYDPDDFHPEPHKGSDRIFACRMYYYVMFGSPDTVVFSDGTNEIREKIEIPANRFGAIPIKITLNGPKEKPPEAAQGRKLKIVDGDDAADFAHISSHMDEDSIYGGASATFSVDSNLNVTISLPSVGRKVKGFYEDEWSMVNMSGLTFTAQADPGAKESLKEDGEWTCTAHIAGRKITADAHIYEKGRLFYDYNVEGTIVGEVEVTCYRSDDGRYGVEIDLFYDVTVDGLYHSNSEYEQDSRDHYVHKDQRMSWDLVEE